MIAIAEHFKKEASVECFDPTKMEIEEWLLRYDDIAKANDWNDNKRVCKLPTHLAPTAMPWYRNAIAQLQLAARQNAQGRAPVVTWAQLKAAMLRGFASAQDRTSREVEIDRRFYCPGTERLIEYWLDKLALCQRLDPPLTVEETVKALRKGLPTKYLELTSRQEFADTDELLDRVREIEKSITGWPTGIVPQGFLLQNAQEAAAGHPRAPRIDNVFVEGVADVNAITQDAFGRGNYKRREEIVTRRPETKPMDREQEY